MVQTKEQKNTYMREYRARISGQPQHERAKQRSRDYKKAQNHAFKISYIVMKGSRCEKCGVEYSGKNAAIFQFHHVNPEEKEFVPQKLIYETEEVRIKEFEKCILLCANCHEMIHSEEY